MQKVTVLMSSYNGERFISEQIDSILAQDYENIEILVRDDGSKDKTTDILNGYQNDGRLKWFTSPNNDYFDINDKIGKSFMALCKEADDSEFYAFADQDDFWLADKLSVAIRQLNEKDANKPLLYCSYAKPVDVNLIALPCKKSKVKKKHLKSSRAIVNSIAAGCTFVFNKPARDLFVKYSGATVGIHDWLLTKIVAIFGEIVYNNDSQILYRQHENNIIGSKQDTVKLKVKRAFNSNYLNIRSNGAKAILESYDSILTEKEKKQLDMLANYRNSFFKKLKLFFSNKVAGNGFIRYFGFKALVLINKV